MSETKEKYQLSKLAMLRGRIQADKLFAEQRLVEIEEGQQALHSEWIAGKITAYEEVLQAIKELSED